MPPKRHLETFGNTIINYYLVSELMDAVGKVRVREGRMQALRPQIITPSAYSSTLLEGFGEQAQKYLEWLGSMRIRCVSCATAILSNRKPSASRS